MKIDYESLNDLQKQLYDVIKQLVNNIEESKDLIDKLNNKDIWQGEGYANFQNKVSSFHTNFKDYCNQLYELPKIVSTAIERYKEIDNKVSETVGTLNVRS